MSKDLNVVLLVGGYYPNFSAVGNCVREIANCFVSRGVNVYVVSTSPDGKETTEDFDGQHIYRVTSKRNIDIIKADEADRSKITGKMTYLTVKSYWAMRKLLARSGMDEGLARSYQRKLEELKEQGTRIDAVFSFILPVEGLKGGSLFCRKYGIPFFPVLYDRYSESRDYFRFTWAHKLKRSHAEKFEKDVFDHAAKIYYIDNWGPYFAKHQRENILRVEHPLVVKKPAVTPEPLTSPAVINAIYQGEINHQMRPPQAMLTVFGTIADRDPDVSLHVFASGNAVEDVRRAASEHPESIRFYGRVSKELADRYYATADITIILANKNREIVSSKIFESVASGYPILYFYFSEDELSYGLLKKYPLVLFVRQDKIDENECEKIRDWMYENRGKRVDFDLVREAYDDATPDMVVDTSIELLNGSEDN
ncbi:Glycosyltransferase involved in cell wall bisynthesis [Ruminococcaceae bacterium YRB3002]|nr:Glycosyltransferase involved in cell wall bisynthesis [Ruminococcaceae bacterium YRB3002]